jgi:hypothetical protein
VEEIKEPTVVAGPTERIPPPVTENVLGYLCWRWRLGWLR